MEPFLYLDFQVIKSTLEALFDGSLAGKVQLLMRTLKRTDAALPTSKKDPAEWHSDPFGRHLPPPPTNPSGPKRLPLKMLTAYLITIVGRYDSITLFNHIVQSHYSNESHRSITLFNKTGTSLTCHPTSQFRVSLCITSALLSGLLHS